MKSVKILALALLVFAASCASNTEKPAPAAQPAAPPTPTPDVGPLGEMAIPPDNPITADKVELGKKLFFDTRLSKTGNGPATAGNIAQALATFLRTIRSQDSPWDKYQAGDKSAVNDDVVKGFDVFSNSDKANCTLCHLPPLFTDTLFHNIGIGFDK